MSFISYAQNFEDVMLWRALGHISKGFYIDVGAQHPILDSVSNAFYEHGWRGVHIEPVEAYAKIIQEARPDEVVLQIALGSTMGEMSFFEIAESGLSTGIDSIAVHHRSSGYNVVEKIIQRHTLAEIFERRGSSDIHWLKIDVEGMEAEVLEGWQDSPTHPWIVVIESTYPNSKIENHQEWEEKILQRGYEHVYFDGLNRYYVSKEKKELSKHFSTPPNIFDKFTLAHSSPYTELSREILQKQENINKQNLEEARKQIEILTYQLNNKNR